MAKASKSVAKANNRRTYYPAKTFDDDLTNLVNLFKSKKWSFSNIDVKALGLDATNQRKEREAHDALETQFASVHQTFGQAQEARYQRFSAALNAARGAFKNDKAVQAELAKLARSAKRTPKKKATTIGGGGGTGTGTGTT